MHKSQDNDSQQDEETSAPYANVYEWIDADPFGFAEAFAEDIARRNGLRYRKADDDGGASR